MRDRHRAGAMGNSASGETNVVMDGAIREVIRRYWGFDALRPLQAEAISAAVQGRDALVVLPTGGGKSLCYQAPALLRETPTLVVSPLIALMKDQVDGLLSRGVSAAFFNSSLTASDRHRVEQGIRAHEYKLVFVAPERFASPAFVRLVWESGIAAVAIDEAHCISHWGHDFREDYRNLGALKEWLPDAAIQGFTATATPRVRDDILGQLRLNDPAVLVGDFFRPNLRYAARKRASQFDEVIDAVRERAELPGIIYCIRRRDVDELSEALSELGLRAAGYHAGMNDAARTRVQDAFAAGELNIVVATVAFGMGIDRADIRYVIHAALPKSLEAYQQETGRAGRDGQPAECLLFYSGQDYQAWVSILKKNLAANQAEQLALLREMYGYAESIRCRHRALVGYFGQAWEREACGACDVCLKTLPVMDGGTEIAQKIMSCVLRTGERFGAGHVSDVLLGDETEKVMARGHGQLSTFGLMRGETKRAVMGWIDQLVDSGLVARTGEYRVLSVTPEGWQVLRGEAEAALVETTARRAPARKRGIPRSKTKTGVKPRAAAKLESPLDPAQRDVFEALRGVRGRIAEENNVPAFMVFSDKTLRQMARYRPQSESELRGIHGVGPAKAEHYGAAFLEVLTRID